MGMARMQAALAAALMSASIAYGADAGLWRLSFRAGTGGREMVLDSAKCGAPVEEKTASGRRLAWRGLDLEPGDAAVDVICTIERNAARGWDEYRIAVSNRSARLGLFETEYPRLRSLLKPGEGSLVRPGGCWGGQRLREKVRGRFPFPDWASPFQLAIFERDAGGGTMVAALDPEGSIKFLNYTDAFDFSFSTPAVDAGVPGKAGAPEFAVAVCRFDGGWVDAAKRYRSWAVGNARWMKKGPLASRRDSAAAAFRDIGMWLLFQYDLSVPLSRTESEIGKVLDMVGGRFPVAVHMYGWWQKPPDGLRAEYPEYPPAREGFGEMCARLEKKGARMMPYLNGRLWDWAQKDFRTVERWMCRNADGTLHKERWGTHDHSAVCPAAEMWGEKLAAVGRKTVDECSVGMLYYDQIASMTAVPCYAADHGHPIGGGSHWIGGYRKSVGKIRAALPDTPLTTENWSEPYTDLFDGFLVWGPNVGNDVPLLPVVYSGYMTPFGCRVMREGEVSLQTFYALQARSFLWGAQPGWERSLILGDRCRPHLEFLLKLAEKRRAALEFFADGEFMGPVENEARHEPLKLKVMRWGKVLDAELPPVMAAEWKAPSGRRMVAVVNVTETPRRFVASGISIDLEPLEVRFVERTSAAGADAGLWRLSFRAGTGGREIVLDSAKCGAPVEKKTASGRRLAWRGLDLEPGDAAVDVICTIERNAARGWDEYRIAVSNRSARLGLFETEYPRLRSLLKPGEGSLVRPGGCWGGQRLREKVRGRFPFPDWASPFQLAIFERDAGGGTMVAALDPEGCIKFLNYTDAFDFSFSTPAVDAGVPGKAGAPEFAVAVYRFDGGWVDAAKRYRSWAVGNARWMKKGPLVARRDSAAAAFRDIGMWFLFQYNHSIPLSRTEDEIGKALSLVGGRFPMAVHMYCWHIHPQDVQLPEYFPARDGFAELVARVSKKGVRLMPYLNGRIWCWENKDFKAAEKWMCRNADGTLQNERWGGQDFSAVCPAAEMWSDWLVELGKKMVNEYGAGALYYDQIASMTAVPCYAADHGHPIGGGTHWVGGYRKIAERIRAALPDTPLTSENWSEPYTDLFDGFLVWGPNVGNDVPLLPAVYSGYMSPFACRVLRDVSDQAFYSLQARSFLWGTQTGWEHPWILEERYRNRLDFLFRLAEKRRSALEFFVDGEFMGPVENQVKEAPLKFKVRRWGGLLDAEMPPVMAAEWRNPSGGRMVAVVNATETARRFEAEGISAELAPLEVKFMEGKGDGKR